MIKARIAAESSAANIDVYDETYQSFSWDDVEKTFTWHKTGKLNIAYEAVDRWAEHPQIRDKQALVFEKGHSVTDFSYLQLKEYSCQWAGLLKEYGFATGDRLLIFLPACTEIYLVMLACSRIGVIFCPVFSSLGYNELTKLIEDAKPRGIVTHPDIAERLPAEAMDFVRYPIFTEGPLPGLFANETLAANSLAQMPKTLEPIWLAADTPLYLIYSSGSTGPPKGIVHAHGDMIGHLITARYVLDLQDNSILWTDGDPAWVTGTIYSTFAPWLSGATSIVQGDPFSASTWYHTLERQKVTVWYTTPMTIMKLMQAGEDLPSRYDFSNLGHILTVGSTLLPELLFWAKKCLKYSLHDTWWMSETGMICIANYPTMDIKAGSMGKPVPGIEAAVLDEKGEPLPFMSLGELALKVPWPTMLSGIWEDEERYQEYLLYAGWFKTGDLAIRDEDGYYYHQGRTDDLIKIGEKFIGPYEIEQILDQHPAVLETAVIAKSTQSNDPHLKAFITLADGFTPSNRLNNEIKAFVKGNLTADTPLKEVTFLDELPKTRSGKLLRRALRARELGLPAGNTAELKE